MKILKYILTFTLVFILFAFCKAYIAFDLTHLHPENWSEGIRAFSLVVASIVTIVHMIDELP